MLNKKKSWHFDPATERKAGISEKPYQILEATEKDKAKVVKFYQHHPVPGYEIGSVKVIYNRSFNTRFELQMGLLQQRDNNPVFTSKWSTENNPQWRAEINGLFQEMAKYYADSDYPAIKLLPLWHGTRRGILDSLFRTGYVNLATTDSGFFGNGYYGAHEAEYAYRVYGPGQHKTNGVLILNWVASFAAYPVIDGDMPKLTGKTNYKPYDTHFVPVVPQDPNNLNEKNYFPCKPQQKHTYTEVVVFESASCLPRYLVELQEAASPVSDNKLPVITVQSKKYSEEMKLVSDYEEKFALPPYEPIGVEDKRSFVQRNKGKLVGGVVSMAATATIGYLAYIYWNTPIPCKNPEFDFNYRLSVNVSDTLYNTDLELVNTHNQTVTINTLAFETSAATIDFSGLPENTTVEHQGNSYTLIFGSPLVIEANEIYRFRLSTPLPVDPQTFAEGIITLPDNLCANSKNGIVLTVGYVGADHCIKSSLEQLFAVRLTPDDGAAPTTANVDLRVNTFVGGYLYQLPTSGVVKSNNVTTDNQLFASIQQYRALRPNMNLILDALLYDIHTLATNSSKMESFIDSLETAIDTVGANGVILSSALYGDFEDNLVTVHKAVKERFLLTHPSTSITLHVPFNQTFTHTTAQTLNKNVDGILVNNFRFPKVEKGNPLVTTNVPYSEQNINQEFSPEKIIQEQANIMGFYNVENKINLDDPLNNTLTGESPGGNFLPGLYSPCAIKDAIENISSACTSDKMKPLPNATKFKNLGNIKSFNNIMIDEENKVVGIGTAYPENIDNIQPGAKVISTLAFNGQSLSNATNKTFVSILADNVQGLPTTSTNNLQSGQTASITAGQSPFGANPNTFFGNNRTGLPGRGAALFGAITILGLAISIGLMISLIGVGYLIHLYKNYGKEDKSTEITNDDKNPEMGDENHEMILKILK